MTDDTIVKFPMQDTGFKHPMDTAYYVYLPITENEHDEAVLLHVGFAYQITSDEGDNGLLVRHSPDAPAVSGGAEYLFSENPIERK